MGDLQGVTRTEEGVQFWLSWVGAKEFVLHVEPNPDHEDQIHMNIYEVRDLIRVLEQGEQFLLQHTITMKGQ